MTRIFPNCLYSVMLLSIFVWSAASVFAEESRAPVDLLDLDLQTLLTIDITPSADASAAGLSLPQPGGQTAQGSRVGILGNQPASVTPFSVTSYTQDYIADQQANDVGNVLQYDSSVRVARGFGNFQQLYVVRGLPIFSDDMTYNGLYGMLPRQYLAADLIERVEILRGPNGFLNGAPPSDSSLGGAINVMPKRAPLQPLNRVVMGIQSDNQVSVATDIARRSTDGHFGIRLNAISRNGDAAMDGDSRQLGLATVGLDYSGEKLRLSADLGYQNHQMEATQPSITIGSGLDIPSAPDAKNSIAPDWSYSSEQDLFGTLRAEYDFNANLTGWLAGGMREGEEDARFAAFLTVTNDLGDYSANRFDVIHEDSVATGELGARYRFVVGAVEHRLTVATATFSNHAHNAYAIYDPFNGNIYNASPIGMPGSLSFAGGNLDNPLVTSYTHTKSYAVADEIALLEHQLLLTLGARWQSIHDKTYDYDSGDLISHYDGDQTTPTLAALYRVTPQLSIYANYVEGLTKGGNAPDSNSNGPVSNAGESLAPVRVKQIETGLKYSTDNLGGSISLFNMDKPVLGFDEANRFTTTEEQSHRGIEWSMFGKPTANIKLLGGISLLDTDLDDKHSIGAPQQLANLNLDWSLANVNGLSLNSHLMYTSEQYADADNQQRAPSWWRWDVGVRYITEAWQGSNAVFRLRATNITNRHYWASVGGYPGAGYLTLGEPRAFIGSLSIDF
ncbi:TonB-dependent receptor [Ketobacter alkanivorans]|uniref:TonB-dependent receptor n=1 Tax=Ketobacter alkanivorans TaxID=1917421 RepID=UPI001F3806EA|nr:TonB-dependent receptor [Ketobacter alkanivorans]